MLYIIYVLVETTYWFSKYCWYTALQSHFVINNLIKKSVKRSCTGILQQSFFFSFFFSELIFECNRWDLNYLWNIWCFYWHASMYSGNDKGTQWFMHLLIHDHNSTFLKETNKRKRKKHEKWNEKENIFASDLSTKKKKKWQQQ